MKIQNLDLRINFRLIALIGLSFLMLVGFALVIQGQIDTRVYGREIKRLVKERTGREVYIRGDISVVLLPVPTVYVAGVELRDINDGKPIPALTVELMQVTPTLSTIYSDNPVISSIVLEKPVLEIERAEDNLIEWDWLSKEFDTFNKTQAGQAQFEVEIINGKVIYRNSISKRTMSVKDVNLVGEVGTQNSFSGGFKINERNILFEFNKTLNAQTGDMPISAMIYADSQNQIKFEGVTNFNDDAPKVTAKLDVNIADIYPWIAFTDKDKKTLFNQIATGEEQKEMIPVLPVQFTGSWSQKNGVIEINDIAWKGLNSPGEGKLFADFSGAAKIDAQMKFTSLDYYKWRALIHNVLMQLSEAGSRQFQFDAKLSENPIPDDMNVSLELTSDKLILASQEWENVNVNVDIADGAVTINQFNITLPGESDMALFGVISQNATTTGMRFEGNIETGGKSLRKVLSIFDESIVELPDLGVEDFYLRSNIYISNDQVRLSESDVKIGDLKLGGGLVVYYDANNPRVEADVKLQGINFDYFRNLWREKQKDAAPTDFFLKFDKTVNLNWLKNLQTAVDLKVQVDKFTFLDREGERAYFRLFAHRGELGIQNVRFYYPEDITEANISLDVRGEKPFINMLINTSELNTGYFSYSPPQKEEKTAAKAEPAAPDAAPEVKEDILDVVPQSQQMIILAQNEPPVTVAPEVVPAEIVPQEEVAAEPVILDEPAVTEVAASAGKQRRPKKWPEELIDMSWMEGFNGIFDISAGKLIHDDLVIDRVKARARLENSQIAIQAFSFAYWQGRCEIAGTLLGGKVPGISVGFTLFNAEMSDFLGSLAGIKNISGKMSISGSFSTSGVNYKSWIAQSEGKMLVTGRGVNIKGLNLQGVVDTVRVSRTAADVLTNVNRVLRDGSTEISVDGPINMKNGVLRTPGIAIKSGVNTGTMNGELKILPWTMDVAALFQFPTLTSDTIPTLLVQVNGSIDEPTLTTDTSSLEAFVVKSIQQK